MNTRQQKLKQWLSSLFTNLESDALVPITGDASSRAYFRLTHNGNTFIIMDTPPDESMTNFIRVAKILEQARVHIPTILRIEHKEGFILMSDLGYECYLDVLSLETADKLYHDALQALLNMQTIDIKQSLQLSKMNQSYIEEKMEIFKQYYLKQHLGITLSPKIEQTLAHLTEIFLQIFTAQPQVFVHLDYHSRNLIVNASNNPGILDFQDAMIGPLGYDLVSLFQDAYISWPQTLVEKWLSHYLEEANHKGIYLNTTLSKFVMQLDYIALQRHLKNLGVFARLHHRDRKSGYLQDIPTLLQYVLGICKKYPELKFLKHFFETQILPKAVVLKPSSSISVELN